MLYVYDLAWIVNERDQPILVPAYIKHRQIAHKVGGTEGRLQRAGFFHIAAWTAFAQCLSGSAAFGNRVPNSRIRRLLTTLTPQVPIYGTNGSSGLGWVPACRSRAPATRSRLLHLAQGQGKTARAHFDAYRPPRRRIAQRCANKAFRLVAPGESHAPRRTPENREDRRAKPVAR